MAAGCNPQQPLPDALDRDTGHVIPDRVPVDEGGTKFVHVGTGGGGEGREGKGSDDMGYIVNSVESVQKDSARFVYSFQSEKNCLAFLLDHTSSDNAHILLSRTSSTQYSTYLSDCLTPKDHTPPKDHAHIPLSHTLSTQYSSYLSDWLAPEDHVSPIDHTQETTSNESYIHVYISPPTMYTVDSCAYLLIYKDKYTCVMKQPLLYNSFVD